MSAHRTREALRTAVISNPAPLSGGRIQWQVPVPESVKEEFSGMNE